VIGKEVKGQKINGSLDFCRIMLDYGVALIPGAPFGADDHVRLSFAVSEEDIAVGLNRIERMLNDVN
ncbi:MAG: aspartate aminotransferase, partial [Clostridia bacterium]|nr:aspartate aminotransferase [Clostridia bacterium]